jgi:hypothetical protein
VLASNGLNAQDLADSVAVGRVAEWTERSIQNSKNSLDLARSWCGEGLAETVGFEARRSVENNELLGFSQSHDPPDPLERRGGRRYCARGSAWLVTQRRSHLARCGPRPQAVPMDYRRITTSPSGNSRQRMVSRL